MESQQFVAGLVKEMEELFSRLGEQEALEAEAEGQVEVNSLLKLALKSELEAAELAALWMPTTPEMDAKQLLAGQCGDEMKHYHLISVRLEELGEDLSQFDPATEGYSPLYHYLRGLRTTVERVAAGPFACEAIARVRNLQFINFCRQAGDYKTAELYETIIQPEEVHHHAWGRDILVKYCTTPETQELAAAATRSTLAVADELRTLKTKTTGLSAIPMS
ncbi:MAG: ferritin-like domain-containing protein [Deltaproteobacteria bacterium]|nr:ferritin-like domain-containing protein [Deltaproteobacteria bacterium]